MYPDIYLLASVGLCSYKKGVPQKRRDLWNISVLYVPTSAPLASIVKPVAQFSALTEGVCEYEMWEKVGTGKSHGCYGPQGYHPSRTLGWT